MPLAPQEPTDVEVPLHLLLFIDKRPSLKEDIQQIKSYLQILRADHTFKLQVIEVGDQPYLAELFKVVAIPTLVKIHPDPKQTLTGSNLVAQLQKCWDKWQQESLTYQASNNVNLAPSHATSIAGIDALGYSSQMIRLSDEVFRLNQEKEKLLEQLRFKEQVLSMLAHDLRSPLTAASLGLETIELAHQAHGSANSMPPIVNQLLRQARNQFKLMDRMIADILVAARGNSAELTINPARLQIGLLCKDVVKQMYDQLQRKSQEIFTDIPQVLPEVYGDEEWLKQVLVNLLENAIKYTPQGGKIEVVVLHRTSQKIQISVADNGPGIPPETRDRIFEDHFRLQRDREKEGYGIGLSLCQRVIRAHYGQIWVECPTSGGSCFHFTIPVYR
jgi:two-component system, OmpR family, clock-associated histidine kinase SasA